MEGLENLEYMDAGLIQNVSLEYLTPEESEEPFDLSTVILALGLISNVVFSLGLGHTWKYWRQVKWYALILLVGNWLEVFFDYVVKVANLHSPNWEGSDASCKFVMSMNSLAHTLAALAVAAMSVHVLMTTITGCQGKWLRHALVILLFSLLSLPYPITTLVYSSLSTFYFIAEERSYCVLLNFFVHSVCAGINFLLFPCLVIYCALFATAVVGCVKSKDTKKGDVSLSDAVITGLLGTVLLFTSFPFVAYNIVAFRMYSGDVSIDVMYALMYLEDFRNIISAILVVVFAYAYVYRHRNDGLNMDSNALGEKQRLVP